MNTSGKLTPALFTVAGVIWVGVIINGSGLLLFWPALASFLSAGATARWPAGRVTVPLAGASAFLGLATSAYQVAASANLSGTSLASVAGYSASFFAVFAALYLVLIFLSLRSPKPAAN